MITGLILAKAGALAAAAVCSSVLTLRYAYAPDAPLRVRWLRYVRHLDTSLTILGSKIKGERIGNVQLLLGPAALTYIVYVGMPPVRAVILLLAIVFAPKWYLGRAIVKRAERIESDVVGFLVALANSLKASPSLGKAFLRVEQVLSGPLAQELGTVSRDIRLGATVDQALLALGARVRSPAMDAALTGILIGRQVGGNLPEILETTAATLRDMERLNGIIRAKTAEGKAQMYVIALAPPVVFYGFDSLNHHYFDPLTSNTFGIGLLAASALMWIGAVILARKILAVDI